MTARLLGWRHTGPLVPISWRSHHPVLVLLGSVVHGGVPGVGAARVDLAHIKHPVPAGREKNKKAEHRPSLPLCNGVFSDKSQQD